MTAEAQAPLVRLESKGTVLTITLDRPDTLNSANIAMLDTVTAALDRVARDASVRVVMLTGSGRAFCSGADIGGSRRTGGKGNENSVEVGVDGALAAASRVVLAIQALDKPVVAAVNGLAAGVGTSLALACDLVVATASAYFLLAFTNIGLMPDGGATAFVPAAIGRAKALRMAMLAERVSATTAAEWGLISHAFSDDTFDGEVADIVAKLASGPPLAYAETKRAINAATIDHLTAALDRETVGQDKLLRTTDFIEGVRAFRQKRRPDFTGC